MPERKVHSLMPAQRTQATKVEVSGHNGLQLTRCSHAAEVCAAGVVLAAGVADGGRTHILYNALRSALIPPHQSVGSDAKECIAIIQLCTCSHHVSSTLQSDSHT